jgi:hypothetical protein
MKQKGGAEASLRKPMYASIPKSPSHQGPIHAISAFASAKLDVGPCMRSYRVEDREMRRVSHVAGAVDKAATKQEGQASATSIRRRSAPGGLLGCHRLAYRAVKY